MTLGEALSDNLRCRDLPTRSDGVHDKTNQIVFRFGVMIVDKFILDSRKAIEAVSILVQLSPDRRISRKRLLAFLYLASRECLKKSGRPLLGGRLVAMKYGPIHGDVYDLINEKDGVEGSAEWSQHFHNDGYHVVLDADPGVNALSRFEVRTLTETLKKHEQEDDFDIAFQTHELAEYRMTYNGRPRTIPLEQIIHAVRLTPMAGTILRDLKEQQEIDAMFTSANAPIIKK